MLFDATCTDSQYGCNFSILFMLVKTLVHDESGPRGHPAHHLPDQFDIFIMTVILHTPYLMKVQIKLGITVLYILMLQVI